MRRACFGYCLHAKLWRCRRLMQEDASVTGCQPRDSLGRMKPAEFLRATRRTGEIWAHDGGYADGSPGRRSAVKILSPREGHS